MTEIMANDLSFKDQTYSGFLSVIQTIINYIFVISWILLSVVVAFYILIRGLYFDCSTLSTASRAARIRENWYKFIYH
jgi:hypothetical protein